MCVHIDTLWKLEIIYERLYFLSEKNTARTLCGRAAPTESQISPIFAAGLVPPPLPVLRAVVIVLTIPPSFFCLLPVDTGLCSGQLGLIGFFPLRPSS